MKFEPGDIVTFENYHNYRIITEVKKGKIYNKNSVTGREGRGSEAHYNLVTSSMREHLSTDRGDD